MSHITVSFSDLLPRLVELWSESHMKWGTSYLKWVTSYIKWVTLYLRESWVTHSCVKFMHCEVSHSRTTCLVACATHMSVTHQMRLVMYQMSRITYQWVTSHMNESWSVHMRMSHGTYAWVTSHINESHMTSGTSCMKRVTSHMNVMAHMKESWLIWKGGDVTSSVCDVTYSICEMSHVLHEMSHVPHECHGAYGRGMAHIKRRRGLMWQHPYVTWRIPYMKWVMSYMKWVTSYVNESSYINESRHTWMSHMNESWSDSHTNESRDSYVTWRIHMSRVVFMRDKTHVKYEWVTSHMNNAFICICDGTHSYMMWLIQTWRDSSILDVTNADVTWLVHM